MATEATDKSVNSAAIQNDCLDGFQQAMTCPSRTNGERKRRAAPARPQLPVGQAPAHP
jgi:hypothetical protein